MKNARLYLRRAELQRLHGDFTSALADLKRAEELDPSLSLVELARGRTYAGFELPELALNAFNRFLQREPRNAQGHLERARTLRKLGKFADAHEGFCNAIALLKTPEPDVYLEQIQVIEAQGDAKLVQALNVLETAMNRCGQLLVLQERALSIEVRLKRYEPALRRIDAILESAERKEYWLLQRGEILQQAGRTAEAGEDFARAEEAFAALPAQQRNSVSGAALLEKLRQKAGR
ncbi:MAG TPA: tetratricopeptide repeat protein [Planctomycetota bacterium]|nr:tetratricopeptide repeat protein [Planctomycetota bacterium]